MHCQQHGREAICLWFDGGRNAQSATLPAVCSPHERNCNDGVGVAAGRQREGNLGIAFLPLFFGRLQLGAR
jgi:hypothetical protein